jgi:HSP20 family protein
MALIRWEPARELRLLSSLFDTPTFPQSTQRRWIPAIDLVETESDFVLRADLPGLSEDDVNIELEDNVLTVSGERKSEHEESKQGYYRVERSSGSFRRTLTLPEGVDADSVKATFDRGVLEIRVPKPEQRKPRKVQITVGGGSEPQTIEGSEPTGAAA